MSTLPSIDFSDLGHGVDVLEECRDDQEQVRAICERLLAETASITGTSADEFRLVVTNCMMFGDRIEAVRPALAALAVECAGAATAKAVADEAREKARQHGRKGGRPRSDNDSEWLRMFDERRARNPSLSDIEICRKIAIVWHDEHGEGRSARTISAGVARAQKVGRKPPFSR